jgi:cyclophilin family peptidyl-prolyl cis-trans isomerase/protein-disulfide isomerase
MRKLQITVLIVLVLALLLAACQPKTTTPEVATEPTAVAATLQPTKEPQTGEPTTCTVLASLLPEVPADQIPPVPVANDNDWILGSLDAEISVIEYTDFQCPYCSLAAPELERFQAEYSNRVSLVVRHFPLISIHDKAVPAARAAEAAGAQGKFFEMHDVLYQEQATWSAQDFTVENFDSYAHETAQKLGLDLKKFDSDYKDAAIQAKIDNSYQEAVEKLNLSGTPTVFMFINGIPYQAPRDYESLVGILNLIDLDNNRYTSCPPMVVDPGKKYTATITTTKGKVVVELLPDKAPLTVNNFVFLARDGYFDNIPFHRVIPGFVAQSGDPSGSGFGGPGYEIVNEVTDLIFDGEGILGMANAGADTNGSQWFITYAAQPNLDGKYTVFGKVLEGMDIVNTITPVDPQQGVVAEPDLILSITITES